MIEIRHTKKEQQGIFEAWMDETLVGEMTYQHSTPEQMIIDHTRVYDGFEGRGIARQLVLAAVDYARANSCKITPVCSYSRSLLSRRDEYKDVIT